MITLSQTSGEKPNVSGEKVGPLLFVFFVLVSSVFSFAQPAAPASATTSKWEKELAAFRAQDEMKTPPKGAVVFTGSSSIRLWTNLASAFPEIKTVNRGFGGSQYSDVVEHLELLVLKHQPKKVVLYSGDNDIAAGRTPADALKDCQTIIRQLEQKLPKTKVYFIAIKPSPSRWHLRDKVLSFNKGLEEMCKASKNAAFIDIYTPMLDSSGKPEQTLFVQDNLHLNGKGYDLWTQIVRKHVIEKEQGKR